MANQKHLLHNFRCNRYGVHRNMPNPFRNPARIATIVPIALAALAPVFITLPVSAQTPPALTCQRQKPFNLKEVLDFVALKRDDRTVGFIQSCHVSFPLDAVTIDQLAQAGASRPVFEALNRVTAADLTLLDARAQVASLELRVQQVEPSIAADRDRALAKFDADSQAERQKAAQIDAKGEFESTAQYNQRRQQNEDKLAQFDRTRQADRAQLAAAWATKASEKEQPYRTRIDFLKAANYPDPRPILYKTYDPDTLQLTATLDGEEYRFEKVPSATAQTLKTNWPKVKVAQPFAEDPLQQRVLLLAALPSPIPGYSTRARSRSTADNALATARSQMNSRNYDAAAREYSRVLVSDPNNAEAKSALAQIQAIELKQSQFLQGLTAAGIWLDPKTQLLWTIKDTERTVNWQQATDYCQALTLGSVSDWRLPTISELKSLYDPSVTKLTHKTILGQLYYRIKGPIELRSIFLWSSNRQDNQTSLWFNPSSGEVDQERSNSKMDMRALCARNYNAATDGIAEGVAPSSAPPATTPSVAPQSTGNLADDSRQATTFYDGKHFAEAAPLYERTCAGGNVYDCDRLGYMYANGLGVAKDNVRAKELETKACDGGNFYGCNNLGFLEQSEKDFVPAATHLAKACAGNNPNGCASLAFQYEGGLGVQKNLPKARDLYNKGCKLGFNWACEQYKRLL